MTEHLVVHYKDEVKANNALDNLRLVTNSQNSQLGHFSRKPAEYDKYEYEYCEVVSKSI